MLLEMREDPLDVPAAAQVMPDHHVKGVAAVGAFRGTGADDPLNLIDRVAVAAAIEADAGRRSLTCR
jgi:hypothetical protein